MSPTELPSASAANPTVTPVKFHGRGGEYFGIAIVNLALSIITLGIYSAWAKVRTKRYFYGNTEVMGSSFEYLATGMQILKGRLLALAIFVVISLLSFVDPIIYLFFVLVFVFASPWLINAGLRFNAYNTSYRGVRFRFKGTYFGAVKAFILFPLLAVITLGLAAPWVIGRMHRYIVTGHAFGSEAFQFHASGKTYIRPILTVVIAMILALVVGIVLLSNGLIIPGTLVLLSFYILPLALKPLLFNIYWANAELKGNRFHANMPLGGYIWVFISNTFAVALTLGLAYPWSQVRMARFQANAMQTLDIGNLGQIVAQQGAAQSALGEELGEIYDVDVGFGV